MTEALISWASPRLARLLPLDDQSLVEVLQYTATLSKAEGAEHLKNLLGDSPQALEFISSFNSRRQDVAPPPQPAQPTSSASVTSSATRDDQTRVPATRKGGGKKQKAPLHNAGPVRRPEDYGNIAGAYRKSTAVDDDYAAPSKSMSHGAALSDALTFSQKPAALQAPKTFTGSKTPSPQPSRDRSPPRQKLPPSASGPLISDLPNVKAKQSKKQNQSGSSTPNRSANTTTTSSINDLTAAIAALELSTNPALSTERRICGCHGTIHPLFEPAPNCLSCGQIICALEGLQPCSFCDTPLLSSEQIQTMIRSLREERGAEKMTLHNAAASHHGVPSFKGPGPTSSDDTPASSAAAAARAHRDKLLNFQRENAARTVVHDEASDYSMTITSKTTQWMTPSQRALALKKQQKYLRELEEERRPEWEKKKTVMSMSIKNGKLVRSYETVKDSKASEKESAHEEASMPEHVESDNTSTRQGVFGRNPLLAGGGLVRPVWKAPEGEVTEKSKEKGQKERKQTWRRVQDDKDDNEQWILDGGVQGFAGEGHDTGG